MPRQEAEQPKPVRHLKVSIALFDADNKPICAAGDELEEGILSEETVAWLLADNLAHWTEGE